MQLDVAFLKLEESCMQLECAFREVDKRKFYLREAWKSLPDDKKAKIRELYRRAALLIKRALEYMRRLEVEVPIDAKTRIYAFESERGKNDVYVYVDYADRVKIEWRGFGATLHFYLLDHLVLTLPLNAETEDENYLAPYYMLFILNYDVICKIMNTLAKRVRARFPLKEELESKLNSV